MIASLINLSHYVYVENYYDIISSKPEVKEAMNRMMKNPTSTIDISSEKCLWFVKLCG